jgi:hypothetical protein
MLALKKPEFDVANKAIRDFLPAPERPLRHLKRLYPNLVRQNVYLVIFICFALRHKPERSFSDSIRNAELDRL